MICKQASPSLTTQCCSAASKIRNCSWPAPPLSPLGTKLPAHPLSRNGSPFRPLSTRGVYLAMSGRVSPATSRSGTTLNIRLKPPRGSKPPSHKSLPSPASTWRQIPIWPLKCLCTRKRCGAQKTLTSLANHFPTKGAVTSTLALPQHLPAHTPRPSPPALRMHVSRKRAPVLNGSRSSSILKTSPPQYRPMAK